MILVNQLRANSVGARLNLRMKMKNPTIISIMCDHIRLAEL